MSIASFLKETRSELRHVTWPTRTKALIYTLIIILFSVALGYMLGGFDAIFRVLLRNIIS
jgi:preprotein translocase SecE subunit